MAVKYVSEFSFPSEFGFHKPSGQGTKHQAKGMESYSKSKAGPSVVPGNTKGSGGGKHTTGSVPKFAKGGSVGWDKSSGVTKQSGMGHAETMKAADKAKGSGSLKYARISDTRSPPATRGDKSSGVQKPAFKSGGHATTPQRYKSGGSNDSLHESGCKCSYCSGGMAKKEGGSIKVAAGKVKDGAKTPWNKDDGTSPGSYKRTPPGEKVTNKAAANSKFDAEGRDEEPATEQNGNVERMSEWSDFKKGGHAKKFAKGGHATTPQRYKTGGQVTTEDRYETEDTGHGYGKKIAAPDKQVKGDGMEYSHGGAIHPKLKNLKHYAHPKGGHKAGGDVKVPGTRTEHPGGHATEGMEVNHAQTGMNEHYEAEAGTPGRSIPHGDYHEMTSGEPHMAMGGMSRGTSGKKNAAMHAKMDHKGMQGISALVGALSGGHPPGAMGGSPMGGPPPGAPMARPMGGPPPGAPPMAPRPMPSAPPQMNGAPPAGGPPPGAMGQPAGMPHMADGGNVQHVVHHHIVH